jgi:hypothetical protein
VRLLVDRDCSLWTLYLVCPVRLLLAMAERCCNAVPVEPGRRHWRWAIGEARAHSPNAAMQLAIMIMINNYYLK